MSERGKYDRTLSAAARTRALRRTILGAATVVFARRGYAAANVADVVREAAVSRRTFYEHFDDLADVLAAVHDASGKLAMRQVDEEIAGAPEPERLERGIRALLALVSQNAGLARVLFVEARVAGPRFAARLERLRAHFAGVLKATLAAAHVRGELARAPDDIAVLAIVAGIEAVGARMADADGPLLDDATREMVRLARGACADAGVH